MIGEKGSEENMSTCWEVIITDHDSVRKDGETEWRKDYDQHLDASSAAEAERFALDLWHKQYPELAGHRIEVKSTQIYKAKGK